MTSFSYRLVIKISREEPEPILSESKRCSGHGYGAEMMILPDMPGMDGITEITQIAEIPVQNIVSAL